LITAVMLYLEPSRTEGMLRAPMGLFSAQPFQWPTLPNLVLAVIVIAVAMRWVWRERRELPDGDVALILAMAATLAFLIVPKRPEYFYRLSLMSTVPGSFLIAFILTRRATLDRYSWAHGALLLAGATVIGVLAPLAAPQPFIVPNAVAELQQFQRQIREPQSTLVIAPHGLEWWAGYFLQTPVGIKVKDAASSRYNRALLLQQTRAFKPPYAGPGFSPQPPGPPAPSAQRIYAGHYIEVYELRAKASAR